LYEEPRVRHLARAPRTRLRPRVQSEERRPPDVGVVPGTRMAVNRDIPNAQRDLFESGASAREKYARLIVGRPGLGALIGYELVVTIAQHVPGALGLVLRRTLYPLLLGSCRNVTFGQNVVLRHPHKIRIADDVVIDDNCLLDAKGEQ